MAIVHYLKERLRQLVGPVWDYCVIWKLNEDPWALELVDCCCGGAQNNDDYLLLPVSSTSLPCKDVTFQHPTTRCCELLSQLPFSLPLDGINAEVLISNQPRWMNNANISELSSTSEEMIETKVLIPVPGGLVELFATKMVQEDQNVVDFILSHCNSLQAEQDAIATKLNHLHPPTDTDFPPYSPSTAMANMNLSSDATADRFRICSSAVNFLHQFSYLTEARSGKDDGDPLLEAPAADHRQQQYGGLESPMMGGHERGFEQEEEEKGGLNGETGRVESGSESDQVEDEDEGKYSKRKNGGKGAQSKNLEAERKRRKKLNERLYLLRSLVPKISKLDRAAILGDAIEYVMELQNQEKELQKELEQNSDDEGAASSLTTSLSQHQNHHHNNNNNIPMEYSNLIGVNKLVGIENYEHEDPSNAFFAGSSSRSQGESSLKRNHDSKNAYDKGQQMEVQVEVAHLEGNEFFIKVFGEQMRGGFVRLMEALDSLGLEITSVNVTSCKSLISYVFTVEKKDSEIVQAEYLRDSLLEMTRNQAGDWADMAKAQGGAMAHEAHQMTRNQAGEWAEMAKAQGGAMAHEAHHEQYQQQYLQQHHISPHFHQFQ